MNPLLVALRLGVVTEHEVPADLHGSEVSALADALAVVPIDWLVQWVVSVKQLALV